MKEVTYEDWQKDPTPRMMWVWDGDERDRVKRKVVYFIENKNACYPIVVLCKNGIITASFQHCAEIEEPKTRRMTHKELTWWLSEKPRRERKFARAPYVYTYYSYNEDYQDEEVPEGMLIREDGGVWREPLVEVEE